jgi:hypothetical protein
MSPDYTDEWSRRHTFDPNTKESRRIMGRWLKRSLKPHVCGPDPSSNADPIIEIGPGLSVARSRLARTLWPGLGKAELAALDRVDANELLRQYRIHFSPPPHTPDYSDAERAETAHRVAEWKRSNPAAPRRPEHTGLVCTGLFLLVSFGVPIVYQVVHRFGH